MSTAGSYTEDEPYMKEYTRVMYTAVSCIIVSLGFFT